MRTNFLINVLVHWMTELSCSNINIPDHKKTRLKKDFEEMNSDPSSFWDWDRLFEYSSRIVPKVTRMSNRDYKYFNKLTLPVLVVCGVHNSKKEKNFIQPVFHIENDDKFPDNARVVYILMIGYFAEYLLLAGYDVIKSMPGVGEVNFFEILEGIESVKQISYPKTNSGTKIHIEDSDGIFCNVMSRIIEYVGGIKSWYMTQYPRAVQRSSSKIKNVRNNGNTRRIHSPLKEEFKILDSLDARLLELPLTAIDFFKEVIMSPDRDGFFQFLLHFMLSRNPKKCGSTLEHTVTRGEFTYKYYSIWMFSYSLDQAMSILHPPDECTYPAANGAKSKVRIISEKQNIEKYKNKAKSDLGIKVVSDGVYKELIKVRNYLKRCGHSPGILQLIILTDHIDIKCTNHEIIILAKIILSSFKIECILCIENIAESTLREDHLINYILLKFGVDYIVSVIAAYKNILENDSRLEQRIYTSIGEYEPKFGEVVEIAGDNIFIEGCQDRSCSVYDDKIDDLYRFAVSGRELIKFFLEPSVTQWFSLLEYESWAVSSIKSVAFSPAEKLDFETNQTYHNIVEVLSLLYDQQKIMEYFLGDYTPDSFRTSRTFYGAATLITYNKDDNSSNYAHGYLEIICDAYSELTKNCMVWCIRFCDTRKLPFRQDFKYPTDAEIPTNKSYTPGFYAMLHLENREIDCKRHVDEDGTIIFTYFKKGTTIISKRLVLYLKDKMAFDQTYEDIRDAITRCANIKEALRERIKCPH